jgi:hypothetical protein
MSSASSHRLLAHKRKKLLADVSKAVKASEAAARKTVPGKGNIATPVRDLRGTLATLHKDLAKLPDKQSQAAAQALAEIDTSLAKLEALSVTKDPEQVMTLLLAGQAALVAATKASKKAGGAWGL